jgi:ketopantoate reductase
MRILVLGAGALGLIFGGRAAEAGHDVAFLCRPATASRLRAQGLRVRSPFGDIARPAQVLDQARNLSTDPTLYLAVAGQLRRFLDTGLSL